MAHGFRSNQPYLNIAVTGAVIGAAIGIPKLGGLKGLVIGSLLGVVSAYGIILFLVVALWLPVWMIRKIKGEAPPGPNDSSDG